MGRGSVAQGWLPGVGDSGVGLPGEEGGAEFQGQREQR